MAGESPVTNSRVVQAFMAVLGAVQIGVFWWAFDQTVRLRTVEMEQGMVKARLEAVQPFASQDRAMLSTLQQQVVNQDKVLEKTVGLVRELNDVVQGLAKAQVEFRISIDRLEQRQTDRRAPLR